MFITDSLIFVELHKTGGSHIGRCLNKILDGKQVGKHNVVPPELQDRFILGSIRNPWDWYVSLWGYGCDKKGSAFSQTTRRYNAAYYWRQLNKEMGKNWLSPAQYFRQLVADTQKPVDLWNQVYADSSNPELFRQWLKLILNPQRRFDIGEGYGFSPLSASSGLLTYRYFKLFTNLGNDLYALPDLADPSRLNSLWDKRSITNFIIKTENLEADLIDAFACAKIPLSEEQLAFIQQGKNEKTNTSSRKSVDFYYDAETIQLVAEKEAFIIARYDYQPPVAG
ncbi:MAG: hypothetical protein U1B30_07440 [Pseudomonadota bacterium]|nr:hypothetical protein [Pseudomonadota bacterium]